MFCTKLYKSKQDLLILPHILAWRIIDKDDNIIGVVGIAAFKGNEVPNILGGRENEFVKELKQHPYYEIFVILKKEYEEKGFGTKTYRDVSSHVLNNTNTKGIIFFIKPVNYASLKAAHKAGAKNWGTVFFHLENDEVLHEELLLIYARLE